MRGLLQLLLILSLLLVVVGIFAVDTQAGLFLLLGVVIAVVLAAGYIALRRYRRIAVPVLIGLAVVAGVVWSLMTSPVFERAAGDTLADAESAPVEELADEPLLASATVTGYRLFVEPELGVPNTFRINEELIYDVMLSDGTLLSEQLETFPVRTVEAERSGFLLQQLTVRPVEGRSLTRELTLTNDQAGEIPVTVCPAGNCPVASVELIDFPEASFVDAQGAENIARSTFIDTETITYTSTSMRRGFSIAYVPAPYNGFSSLFRPLLGASTFEDWIFAFVGVLGSFVLFPILASFIENYLEGKVFSGFKWLFGRKNQN